MSEEDCPISVGQVIDEKYRIERLLGRGGIGIVAKAQHLVLNHPVALKVLRNELAQEQRHVARFLREARAAVRLESEHVARVLDVGTLEDGAPYMVMEYLEGEDLARRLDRSGPLTPEQVAGFLIEACDGLAEAHAAGIVHRDVKPANLFLARGKDGSERLRVLDFGIAKAAQSVSEGDFSATETGGWIGSPRYMSPEQMRPSSTVDARADIWALGITAYELLSGASPFDAESMSEICGAVLHVDPTPLHQRVEVSEALSEVIMRCLEKDPARRFASIRDLAAAVGPFAPATSQAKLARIHRWSSEAPKPSELQPAADALTVSSHGPPSAFSSSTTDGLSHEEPVRPRSRRRLWWAALAAVVPLAGTLFLLGGEAPALLTTGLQPERQAYQAFLDALSRKPSSEHSTTRPAPPMASTEPEPTPRTVIRQRPEQPKEPTPPTKRSGTENPLLMDRE